MLYLRITFSLSEDFFAQRGFPAIVVALLLILWYSTKPSYIHVWIDIAPRGDFYPGYTCPLECYAINAAIPDSNGSHGYLVTADYILPTFLAPFLYNFFADWLALIVTRRFLTYISRVTNNYLIIVMLALSTCVILFIAAIGYTLYITLVNLLIGYRIIYSQFLDPRRAESAWTMDRPYY